MCYVLEFEPAEMLLPWMPHTKRPNNIVLLGMEADFLSPDQIRFAINVAFRSVSIRVSGSKDRVREYCIATTAARIRLETLDGKIAQSTQGQPLNVKYQNTTTHKQVSDVVLKPSAKFKSGGMDAEVSGPEIKLSSEHQRQFTASYEGTERYLECTNELDSVEWHITLPKGNHIIVDFIRGNLYLFAICQWEQTAKPKRGIVRIVPSSVDFFDDKGQPMSPIKRLRMYFEIMHQNAHIENPEGLQIEFHEVGHGQ